MSRVLLSGKSRDPRKVISICGQCHLRGGKSKTGQLQNTFTGHEHSVYTVRFSPDGTKLVSAAGEGSLLRFWTVGDFSHYGAAAPLKRWAHVSRSSPGTVNVEMDEHGRIITVHLGGGEIMSHLKNLTDVEKLKLIYTYGPTAEGLRHVKNLTNVKVLNLWGNCNFSDGVMQLRGMTKVENLCLHKIRVTDDNMRFLKDMKGCKAFQMTLNPVVTDVGIAHLAGLTELKSVYLTCPQLTDECLKSFHDMHHLNSL